MILLDSFPLLLNAGIGPILLFSSAFPIITRGVNNAYHDSIAYLDYLSISSSASSIHWILKYLNGAEVDASMEIVGVGDGVHEAVDKRPQTTRRLVISQHISQSIRR